MTQNLNTPDADIIVDILKSPSTLLRLAAFLLMVAAFYLPVATYEGAWGQVNTYEKLTLTYFYSNHVPMDAITRIGLWPYIFASACGASLLIAPFSRQVGRILDLLAVIAGAILCVFIIQNIAGVMNAPKFSSLRNFRPELGFFMPTIALALMGFQLIVNPGFARRKA